LSLILGGHEHAAHTVAVGDRYVLKADADAVSAQFVTVWGTGTSGGRRHGCSTI
jgi:hypothetical protein